jgi:prepilin-type processing-associated H-X9-DG protein
MNPFRIVISLIVIAAALLLAVRYRSFRELKSEQEKLRQQSEEVSNLRAAIAQRKTELASSTNHAGLTAAERSELLRLRGQTGSLRRELAREMTPASKASRTTAASPGAAGVAEDQPVTQGESELKMARSRQFGLALIMYAHQNQGRLPTSLADVQSLAGAAQGMDDLELVQSGVELTALKTPSRTIVLREKQPWKGANGRWNRSYTFADGHVEIARSDSIDFTEWEKSKTSANPLR